MLDGLFIAAILGTVGGMVKESLEPTIPAENWANKDLYYKDLKSGMSQKELHRNLVNGKYKATKKYPEPRRTKNGKILIENSELYYRDIREYGGYQVNKWLQQGKYNLTPEEKKK